MQAHQLINKNSNIEEFCATVQCYQYGDDDKLAWPYFDYLQDCGETQIIDEFDPDSDFTYGGMRDKVLQEYFDALQVSTSRS